jgi:hypothetical protein
MVSTFPGRQPAGGYAAGALMALLPEPMLWRRGWEAGH